MEAQVRRGHLEYRDQRGSYRIPLGRRCRKCLAVLDRREGEYSRSLEIDLFTGFVYYCVDNATSGGLSYYYDMSSKKVGHYFIHRYIRTAISHGFTASPQEMEIFEKLPCSGWEEELIKLPGWKEAIDNRVRNLLLPAREVVSVQMRAGAYEGPAIRSVSFRVYPAAYPAGIRDHVYLFDRSGSGEPAALLYRNRNLGNEFFGGDGEYELFLTKEEDDLLGEMAKALAGAGKEEVSGTPDGRSGQMAQITTSDRILPSLSSVRQALRDLRGEYDGEKMVLKELTVRFEDGSVCLYEAGTPEEAEAADDFRTLLHGMLRREAVMDILS